MAEPGLFSLKINSRFQIRDKPFAAPGKCIVCGAVDRPVVDIGWDVDYYGVVYFCVLCMKECAEIMGMVDGSVLKNEEADSARLFHDYLVKNDLKVISNAEYHDWRNTVSNLHASIAGSDYTILPFDDEEDIISKYPAVKNNGRVAKQVSKPVIDKRPVSVPAGNSDGGFLFGF